MFIWLLEFGIKLQGTVKANICSILKTDNLFFCYLKLFRRICTYAEGLEDTWDYFAQAVTELTVRSCPQLTNAVPFHAIPDPTPMLSSAGAAAALQHWQHFQPPGLISTRPHLWTELSTRDEEGLTRSAKCSFWGSSGKPWRLAHPFSLSFFFAHSSFPREGRWYNPPNRHEGASCPDMKEPTWSQHFLKGKVI